MGVGLSFREICPMKGLTGSIDRIRIVEKGEPMRSLRYLNTVLTILALLLTLNLWTAWSTTSVGDTLSISRTANAQGIVNAGAQRKEMINQVHQMNIAMVDLKTTLTDGAIRVHVDAIPTE